MHKNVLEPVKYDNLISSLNNLQHHIQEKNIGMSMIVPKLSCSLELPGDFWIPSRAS